MVKHLLFFILISMNLMAQDVTVTSEMNYTELFAGSPLTGTITVTHNKNDKVDVNSFKIADKPLKVNFLNDVVMSEQSPIIVSIYAFEIPTLPKGLHVLPQISATVGNKTYRSYSRSFEVFGSDKSTSRSSAPVTAPPQNGQPPKPPQPSAPQMVFGNVEDATLKLETKIQGPTEIYPGQQTKLTYRFLYSGHIDLTKEELPMLEGFGLKKVGDKLASEYEEDHLNVSEFSQIFEGVSPGKYTYGPSVIEGRAFQENGSGKVYSSKLLRSEASDVTITVLPFPTVDKPASFNGSIGTYTFKATLNDGSSFNPGEKITLTLEMTGDKEWLSTVQAPDLCCQPGFSGNFKPSDLPPISSINGNTKRFLVELKALSAGITSIPPIEFSSFNPVDKKFITVKSPSIPLNISSQSNGENTSQKTPESILHENEKLKEPSPIEIEGNVEATNADLKGSTGGSWWYLLLLPILAALLYPQVKYKKETVQKQTDVKEPLSEDLFKAALKADTGSAEFYRLLQKSLILALKEKGIIESSDIEPESLEKTGLQGEVRIFIEKLNELRFAGGRQFNQMTISTAKELFSKIHKG